MIRRAKWFAVAAAVVACVAVGAAQAAKASQSKDAPKAAAQTQTQTQTMMGKISDSMCGAKHGMGGKSDADCVAECIKGGAQYVFVTDKDSKIYKIANQKFADLAVRAGQDVQLTGTFKDDTITVSKIAMPKGK